MLTVHQTNQPLKQIPDIAERAGLAAIAVQPHRFAPLGLNDEITHHPAVVYEHARAIVVEDVRHPHHYASHGLVIKTKNFSDASTFVERLRTPVEFTKTQ